MTSKIEKNIDIWNVWWIFQLVIPVLICIVLFTFNISINRNILLILWIISMTMLIKFFNKRIRKIDLKLVYGLIFIMIISMIIQNTIWDTSWDGQCYHYDAIIGIIDGWNPIYNTGYNKIGMGNFIYSEHYPKSSWIFSAFYGIVFGNVEIGKVYHIYAMLLLIGVTLRIVTKFRDNIKLKYIILGIICITFNPVFISQINTFYIDGYMGTLLFTFCISVYISYVYKNKLYTIISCLTMSLIINIKFTGLGYVGVIVLFTFFIILKYNKKSEYHIRSLFIPLIITGIISVTYIGFDSYMRNLLEHGHPFYPIGGRDSIDIMTNNTPEGLRGKNYITKIINSYFSKTSNSSEENIIKFPLDISIDEFEEMISPDTRIAGFGPMFSIIIIISIFSIIILFIYKKYKYLLLILPMLLTVIINPEAWWARYVPLLWFIPIIIFVSIICEFNKSKIRLIGISGLIIMSINCLGCTVFLQGSQIYKSSVQKKGIDSLKGYNTVYISGLNHIDKECIKYKMKNRSIEVIELGIENIYKYKELDIPYGIGTKVLVEELK